MMKFDDMIYGLQQDIEIPENVWGNYSKTLSNLPDKPEAGRRYKPCKRKLWSAAAAAILLVSTISISAAARIPWSKGLELGLQITEPLRIALEENHMSNFVEQPVTQGNVTVTAQQSIVDNYFAYLSFKVDGYTLAEGAEPGFSEIEITVDNDDDFSWSSSFYDGTAKGSNGEVLDLDGKTLTEDGKISYQMKDGSLEFQVLMMNTEKGYFLDKPVHARLKGLGVYDKKAGNINVEAQGEWEFDWTLAGSSAARQDNLNAPLENSDATVLKAELSPISVSVTYQYPRQGETKTAFYEEGEEFEYQEFKEPPYFTGVRMKDGTIYTGISDAGMGRYESEDSDRYEYTAGLSRVIDVEQVDSLLFIKSYPEGEQPLTEENLYFVSLE